MVQPKWTLNPPCEAENFLEDLFINKKINPTDSANKIHQKYTLFRQFSQAVFRNNYKRLRDRFGLGLREY